MQNIDQVRPEFSSVDHDEYILVVKRSTLFCNGSWQGLNRASADNFPSLVEREKEFHPRSIMETDPRYKQIIPYLVFRHKDRYFLMQRKAEASEQRLKSKYSLGIGGHIRKEDLFCTNDILQWAKREFNEEVDYKGTYNVTSLGVLNDDTNPVGEVHLGYVLLLEGNSPTITIRSELHSGALSTLEECAPYYTHMERWSQIVYDALKAL